MTRCFAESFPRLLVDLLRYGAASALALIVDAGALLLLVSFGVNYLIAAAIGFSSGLLAVYGLSVRYVFDKRRKLRPSQEVAGFLATGAIGLLLTQTSMAILVGVCGLPIAAAKIPTVALVFLFNFLSRRTLLFSDAGGDA